MRPVCWNIITQIVKKYVYICIIYPPRTFKQKCRISYKIVGIKVSRTYFFTIFIYIHIIYIYTVFIKNTVLAGLELIELNL